MPERKSNDKQVSRPEVTTPASLPLESKPKFSRGKLWVFRFTAFVILPLVLLGVFEAGLRLGDYGYSTSFFKPIRIKDQDCLVENDKFGLRFFPPALARSPSPILLKAVKDPGTYRIFLFGESAAQGDPKPAYGPGRYLQALLRDRFPQGKFEVICVATTAINSHVILPIAQECARYQGDLWIIYMGNNEMVGPFGATTVFGSRAPSLLYVRTVVALQRSRIGQLLVALGQRLKRNEPNASSWGGMQMFLQNRIAPTEPRKEIVYKNFQRNLDAILRAGQDAHARILLNTVAVNLKDCAPFASLPDPNLAPGQHESAEKLMQAGLKAEATNGFEVAAQQYLEAARLEPHGAEVQFRLGNCLSKLRSNPDSAREHFQLACDYDALPFRADSRLNKLIAQAAEQVEPKCVFLDAAMRFGTNVPDGAAGHESFYEHVHFNFDGNYRLARAWAEKMGSLIPGSFTNGAKASWASQPSCERALALTDWNRLAVLQDVQRRLGQPPFTAQLNHNEQMQTIRSAIRDLRARMDSAAANQAREIYVEALAATPHDHRLHENFAEFLEQTGDLSRAVTQWQEVKALLPHHHLAYFQAGRLLAHQGKLNDALPLLSQALALRPDLSEGWVELGNLHTAQGKLDEALKDYGRAQALLPQDPRVYYHRGRALSKLNRRADAIQQLRECVRLKPDYWEAVYALGEELAFDGQVKEAKAQFEQVLRLRPDYAMAHFNLGVALVQESQLQPAEQQFEETLRLDPQNKLAQQALEQLRTRAAQLNAQPKP